MASRTTWTTRWAYRNGPLALVAFALWTLTILPAGLALAQACSEPVPVTKSSRVVSTEGALTFLTGIIGKVGAKVGYKQTQEDVLIKYPKADQAVFNAMYYISVCEIISKEPGFTADQKIERLTRARNVIFAKAPNLPAPVIPPLAVAVSSPPPQAPTQTAQTPELSSIRVVDPGEKTPQSWAAQYLKPPPSVLNMYNRFFVVVASLSNNPEADKKVHALRKKFPDLDFALYGPDVFAHLAPKKSNTHWGIMLATWASRSEANEALTVAKQRIAPKSYIWTF